MQAEPMYQESMQDEELTEAISLRITKDDRALLDNLSRMLPMKPLSIARAAMRLGMWELEKNPGAIVRAAEAQSYAERSRSQRARPLIGATTKGKRGGSR